MLEPEVAVPLDDRECEHVPVAADQLQYDQRPEHGAVCQSACSSTKQLLRRRDVI